MAAYGGYSILNEEQLIKDLNTLIHNAIINGGDAGGAYMSCPDLLAQSIYTILLDLNLIEKYKVIKDEWGWNKIVPVNYEINKDKEEYEFMYMYGF